jgi:diaminopimelate decarboxylase
MDHFRYLSGELVCESLPLATLAGHVGTPTFVYSKDTLTLHFRRLQEAFAALHPLICFSVKSCPNLGVLRTLVDLGAGLDVVSGGELTRARLAGCPSDRTVFAGVGKTESEILSALGRPETTDPAPEQSTPIALFNVESEPEFQAIATAAKAVGVTARAALRVNPDIDAVTHKYTTTGTHETKFGVDFRRAKEFFKSYDGHPNLKLSALHMHLGSPVPSAAPYVQACRLARELIDELESVGHRIDTLNIGGGFGADYTTGQALSPFDYAGAIVPELLPWFESRWERTGRKTGLILEPGRFIAASAGVLLTRVIYVKNSGTKRFIICDAGMHTLLRPSHYNAFHFIWPVRVAPQHVPLTRVESPDLPGLERCDVVGPICETGDFLALDRPLPPLAPGDLLAVFTAGAYGMSMSSRYNSHPLSAEVLVSGSTATVVRERETMHDLIAHERTPRPLHV